jgi:FtsP/CotA-like multicopper oxidase with cupredoxin domain
LGVRSARAVAATLTSTALALLSTHGPSFWDRRSSPRSGRSNSTTFQAPLVTLDPAEAKVPSAHLAWCRLDVDQIGNEGGFLGAAVNLTTGTGNRLLMSPAERADVIVDFTNVPPGSHVLGNVGPDAPFSGLPIEPEEVADPATTGQVMQFRVVPAVGPDPTTPPRFLQLPAIDALTGETRRRPLALLEEMSMYFADAPAETLLGTVDGDPNAGTASWTPRMWSEPITENPQVGDTEVCEFYNGTADARPMHIHEVLFQVVDRQPILVDEADRTFQVVAGSTPAPPEPGENGWKDTVIAYPEQVTWVRMRFTAPGQFVWHCHIVEHEDNEMMRPYRIGPEQPGQPMPHEHGGGM